MILDFPPHTEQLLIQTAQQQGLSIEELIAKLLEKSNNSMINRALAIQNPNVLGDGLTIQKELRHEWG